MPLQNRAKGNERPHTQGTANSKSWLSRRKLNGSEILPWVTGLPLGLLLLWRVWTLDIDILAQAGILAGCSIFFALISVEVRPGKKA